jgi:hypothetical protein
VDDVVAEQPGPNGEMLDHLLDTQQG